MLTVGSVDANSRPGQDEPGERHSLLRLGTCLSIQIFGRPRRELALTAVVCSRAALGIRQKRLRWPSSFRRSHARQAERDVANPSLSAIEPVSATCETEIEKSRP